MILVAVDGSGRAPGVFKAAADFARATQARALLFRTLQGSPDFTPPGAAGVPLSASVESKAREQLAALAASAPDVRCEIRIEEASQPWRAILAAADAEHADLIVLGSHGYHGWDRILGTTAGKVASLATCDVLVVHERPSEAAPGA